MTIHDESTFHKLLHLAEDIWPLLSGMGLVMLAGIKLWWSDRRATKKRIANIEIMCEHMVTQDELHSCREDVRQADDENLEKIYHEIKENQKINAQQHQDIMREIIRMHGGKAH